MKGDKKVLELLNEALKNELTSLSGRGHALVAAVSARFHGKRAFSTFAWLAFLVLVVVGVGWLVEYVPSLWRGQDGRALFAAPPGAAIIAQVTAFVSWIAGWMTRQVRTAAKAADDAARLDAKIQSKVEELDAASASTKDANDKEAQLQTQIAALDRDIRGATEDLIRWIFLV